MRVFFSLCFLAILILQGISGAEVASHKLEEKIEAAYAKIKGFTESEWKKAEQEAKNVIHSITEGTRLRLKFAHSHVSEQVNQALAEVQNLPAQCTQGVELKLKTLHSSSFNNIINCPNFTNVIVDAGNILYDTAGMGWQLLVSVKDLIDGFTSCTGYNPFKVIPCYFKRLASIIHDLSSDLKTIREYIKNLGELDADIIKQIQYCSSLPSVQLTQKIQNIVQPAKICAKQLLH